MENIDLEIVTDLHVSGITDYEEIVVGMPSVCLFICTYSSLASERLTWFHSYSAFKNIPNIGWCPVNIKILGPKIGAIIRRPWTQKVCWSVFDFFYFAYIYTNNSFITSNFCCFYVWPKFIIVAWLINVYCRFEVKMAHNNRDFTAKDCRGVMNFLFLKAKSAKKNYDDILVILVDKPPFYSTVKNWVPRYRTGHLNTENEECSWRPTQVTIPENVEAIHSMILDDRRISTKKIAETLAITREESAILFTTF
jgi:hypothetical protein